MVGHACPGPLGGEGSGCRSNGTSKGVSLRWAAPCGARVLVAQLLERGVAVLRDNNVLQHRYTEQSPCLLQPVRYLSVLRRWRRVAAWVVVSDNNSGGIVQYRGRGDVAGMDYRGVDRPYRYYLFVYQFVPRIEILHRERARAAPIRETRSCYPTLIHTLGERRRGQFVVENALEINQLVARRLEALLDKRVLVFIGKRRASDARPLKPGLRLVQPKID